MPEYRNAKEAVDHIETKWDGFTIHKTEHPYRCQKGSGREQCFALAEDGMRVGDWTRKCAGAGYDSKFATGSLLKLQGAKEPGWVISEKDDQGRTVDEVKKIRDEDPAKIAEREAKKAAKAEERERKKAEREAAKAAKAEAAKGKKGRAKKATEPAAAA